MDRTGQRRARDLGHQRQRGAEKAFHVAGAAAVEPVAAHFRRERIARPVLAVDRHDVGMAGEHIAAVALRTETREQIALALSS